MWPSRGVPQSCSGSSGTQGSTELKPPWSGFHRAVPAPQAVLEECADQLEHSSVSEETRLSANNDFIKAVRGGGGLLHVMLG